MDDRIKQALNDGHIVTVGGLNKVYRFLLNKIGDAGSIYRICGNKQTFNDLLLTETSDNGSIYNVIEKDPEGYTGANYVCILKYRIYNNTYQKQEFIAATETSPVAGRTYYFKLDGEYLLVPVVKETDNPKENEWYYKDWVNIVIDGVTLTKTNIVIYDNGYYKTIWDALGGVVPKADANTFGTIKLGFTSTDTEVAVETNSDGRAFVKAASPLTAGTGIKIDNNVVSNTGVLSVSIGKDNGSLSVNTNGKTEDVFVKGLGSAAFTESSAYATAAQGVLADSAYQKDKDGIPKSDLAESVQTSLGLADSAVQKPSGGAGSSSLPIYINGSGVPTTISTISLGDNTKTINVAKFENNTSSSGETNSTVIITGPAVNSSITKGSTAVAALLVNGGIVATSGISASKVYHAVWNDISDAVEVQDDLLVEPGYCYYFDGKEYHKTNKYCQKGIIGIHSDTAGDILGRKGRNKEIDVAIGGFVLAHVDKKYEPGTPLTCTEHGKLTEIKKFDVIRHPERIVGTYWKPETAEYWGPEDNKVSVVGRHWIKVK